MAVHRPLGLLAIVLIYALGWSLERGELTQPVTRQVLSPEGWDGLNAPFGRYAAMAPDGSSMILPVEGQLALKMQSSTEITPIPGTEGARDVVYSPDGQWITYAVGTELFKRPIVGGSPVRLAEDADGATFGMDWLDDGTILYEWFHGDEPDGRTRGIAQIPDDGGEPVAVFWPEDQIAPVWVHGLPGARGALVISCLTGTTCTADRAQLHVVNLQDLTLAVHDLVALSCVDVPISMDAEEGDTLTLAIASSGSVSGPVVSDPPHDPIMIVPATAIATLHVRRNRRTINLLSSLKTQGGNMIGDGT